MSSSMRILWLSNKVLSADDMGATGTWLDALAHGLSESGEIQLGNITEGKVGEVTQQDLATIQQWIIPDSVGTSDGLPRKDIVARIIGIVEHFSPDIIHVWGVESYWGLLVSRKIIRGRCLLEIQGLKGIYERVYYGGLSLGERIASTGIKEILRGRTLVQERDRFRRWGKFEQEMILGHKYITVQSIWTESWIKAINPTSTIFHTNRALRAPFYDSNQWTYSGKPTLFYSSAYPVPYKGLHVIIRALPILVKRWPDIQLRIAGAVQHTGIRKDGYITWVKSEAERLGIDSCLTWLGPISAEEIVSELGGCSVVVLPSYIETYCVALAEAMIVGTPTVVAYNGGTSHIARDRDSALFFPPGDEAMCANLVAELLLDRQLAERISRNAREIALHRNRLRSVVENQIQIYRQVFPAVDTA